VKVSGGPMNNEEQSKIGECSESVKRKKAAQCESAKRLREESAKIASEQNANYRRNPRKINPLTKGRDPHLISEQTRFAILSAAPLED
jgi:hypothetical protein